jgi:hypothetical protein
MAGPIGALERRRVDAAQVGENAAREAISYGWFKTAGWGEVKAPAPVLFDVVFTTRPAVAYSFEVVGGQTAVVDGRFPHCGGGVYQWILNTRGHYTGAYVLVTVSNVSSWSAPTVTDPGPAYTIDHCFIFVGQAYKEFPGLTG